MNTNTNTVYCRDCGGGGALGDSSICTTCEGSGYTVIKEPRPKHTQEGTSNARDQTA